MSEITEALEQLKNHVASLPLSLDVANAEFQQVVDTQIKRGKKSSRQAVESAFDKLDAFKAVLRADLSAAITIAAERELPMPECSKLAESLSGGFDVPDPLQFVFGARLELERLRESLTRGDWREHNIDAAMELLGIESRDTLGKHAASDAHPYVERSSRRGQYRINHADPFVKGRE